MSEQPKVAISADLLGAFASLPQAQQGKVAKFITNFQRNPRASGINYERINDAADPNMRSVRIDQAYRGIVLQPEQGNVYMLLWVDHHDEAYAWARRHRCKINSESGSLQVYEVLSETVEPAPVAPQAVVPDAFAELKDKQLMRLGVPAELLPLVRRVHNEAELDAIEHRLPVEAYEGLFLYLAGSRYDQIINEREHAEAQIDTSDFIEALQRTETRSRFTVVEDEDELQRMLNAPLDKWRVFLHPSQQRLAQGHKNGAVRVLGGAGTGKTVVALHRAKWLAEHIATPERKILFTTFTRNLATDIDANLKAICNAEQLAKIEVINLDRWVSLYLRRKKYDYSVIFSNEAGDYWQQALDLKPLDIELPDAFYQEEWQKIIQPLSIETLEQYKHASRIGRGTRLNRSERVKVWPVFEEYRNLLTSSRKKEVDDAYRDAAALLAHDAQPSPYACVVVDEGQDMSTQAYRLIRQLVPEGANDLFIVGDGHQRIYGRNKVVLSHCGINIRGRSHKLRINYRTTEEIRRWAVRLLEDCNIDDLDGGTDDNRGYKSLTHGSAPDIHGFQSLDEQVDFIKTYLDTRFAEDVPPGHICIVARTGG
ncbi:MAG: AAA family ATPase, partial [Candidatus Competibacteraceae bacterium]|nr:AAA family ATPase [Candidatus Competibacteraceae bacterium]